MMPINRTECACPHHVLHKCSRAVRHLMGLMRADGSRNNGLHAIVTRCAEQRVAASLPTVDAFSNIVRTHVSFVAHPFAPDAPSLGVARPSNHAMLNLVSHCHT